MEHEESLRYKKRMVCYSGKHAVIQRPHTSGGKCLEGKSVFVNDMGQLFWGRLDLCTHRQASSITLGAGFAFHSALSLLSHSDLPLLLWAIKSSLDGNLFTLCSACQIADIVGVEGKSFNYLKRCNASYLSILPSKVASSLYCISCSLNGISTGCWSLGAYMYCGAFASPVLEHGLKVLIRLHYARKKTPVFSFYQPIGVIQSLCARLHT